MIKIGAVSRLQSQRNVMYRRRGVTVNNTSRRGLEMNKNGRKVVFQRGEVLYLKQE